MIALLRLSSELVLKSDQVRTRFLKQLVRNIKDAFRSEDLKVTIQSQWSRIFVNFEDEKGIELLQRIFGISSFSILEHQCESVLETIVADGVKIYESRMDLNKTFAIKARRAGKSLPFTSMDVAQQLGGALSQGRYKVNLSNPEFQIQVEVRPGATYFFSSSIKGACGLPLGTGGKAVALLSGGFDSPAAIWMMQKRGIEVDYVLCNMAGDAYERSVLQIAKHLADKWSYGSRPRFHVLDFQPVADHLRTAVNNKYVQVILKRVFIRVANDICDYLRADAIITGEAVGQVSSQTLKNLRAIEDIARYPILRPLIAIDKEDIIALCRKIGTEPFSAKIQEFCQLVPQKPATACSVERANKEEKDLDEEIIKQSLASRKTHNLRLMDELDIQLSYLTTIHLPDDSIIIDCREENFYDDWHFPNAINIEYYKLLDSFKQLDKAKNYVIYCPHGMQSSVVAERMQSEGYLAYSFKGGIPNLKKLLTSTSGDET